MKKFEVTLRRTVVEEAIVEFYADSASQAVDLAFDAWQNLAWSDRGVRHYDRNGFVARDAYATVRELP